MIINSAIAAFAQNINGLLKDILHSQSLIMSKLHAMPKISLSQTPKLADSQLFMHHITQYACRQGVNTPIKQANREKHPNTTDWLWGL